MELSFGKWYKVLAPRAVVLVSTVSKKGVSNAAPFSFVMPVSFKPPLLAFASSPAHDTVRNIDETGDFVANVPGEEILKELWISAEGFPPEVSEFKEAGLTEAKSAKVKSPGVKEAIARFECKLSAKYAAGDHVIIVGEVLRTEVRDEYFSGSKYNVSEAKPLMHIAEKEFALPGKIVRP